MVNLFYRVTDKIWDFQNKTVQCTLMVLCSSKLFKFFIEKLYSVHTLMVPCSCQLFYFFIEKLYSVHAWFPAAVNFLNFSLKNCTMHTHGSQQLSTFKFFIEKLYRVHSWFPAGSLQLSTFLFFHWKTIQCTLMVPCSSCQLFKFFIEKLYSVHSWFPAADNFFYFSLKTHLILIYH